MTKLKPC